MPQSLSHVIIHTVFSTKNREPFFQDVATRTRVLAYLGGIAKTLDCLPLIVGGHTDHIHILSTLSRTCTQADFVKELKRKSSIWFKETQAVKTFAWQRGYGIFSVSESEIPDVKQYIQDQETHHRKHTFQDEFRHFMKVHKIPFDEHYVWD